MEVNGAKMESIRKQNTDPPGCWIPASYYSESSPIGRYLYGAHGNLALKPHRRRNMRHGPNRVNDGRPDRIKTQPIHKSSRCTR